MRVQQCDVDEFRRLLPTDGSVLSSADNLDRYNQDWMGIFKGNSSLVLRPSCTTEVSSVLKYCNERGIQIVPQVCDVCMRLAGLTTEYSCAKPFLN